MEAPHRKGRKLESNLKLRYFGSTNRSPSPQTQERTSQYFANTQLQLCPSPGAGVHVAVKMLPANDSRVEKRASPSHLCAHKHMNRLFCPGAASNRVVDATVSNQCAGLMVRIATAAPYSWPCDKCRWAFGWGWGWSILSSQAVEYQLVQTAPALVIKLSPSHTFEHSCNHWRITTSLVISLKDREL